MPSLILGKLLRFRLSSYVAVACLASLIFGLIAMWPNCKHYWIDVGAHKAVTKVKRGPGDILAQLVIGQNIKARIVVYPVDAVGMPSEVDFEKFDEVDATGIVLPTSAHRYGFSTSNRVLNLRVKLEDHSVIVEQIGGGRWQFELSSQFGCKYKISAIGGADDREYLLHGQSTAIERIAEISAGEGVPLNKCGATAIVAVHLSSDRRNQL